MIRTDQKFLSLASVELVKREPRSRRVHLQVEGGGFRDLLLVTGQLREAVGEGVGDAELHVRFRSRSERLCD